MQKITPFLWFDHQAEEAVNFYISTFRNSKILEVICDSEAAPGQTGTVMTIRFQLDGQEFTALNGGPQFKFTEAISFAVNCDTQEEVDRLWDTLSEGGAEEACGWLKVKYGVSWQIVPTVLFAMLQDADPVKVNRVTQVMLQMQKLDIKALQEAYQ